MNRPPPYREGDRVRILMDEPVPMARLYTPEGEPNHPWAETRGWPPYREFVVTDYASWHNDRWTYKGPDGAGWGEETLELVEKATRNTRFSRIMDNANGT